MFEKDDERRLYWLIEMYLLKRINAKSFCDEFYFSFGQEFDSLVLSDLEIEGFKKLFVVSERFSPFKEDHINIPGVYYTEEDLRKKIIETKEALKYEAPLYKLLFDVKDQLPNQDINKIIEFIDNFDWASACETLCVQTYQNHIPITREYYEKISDFGDKVGVDPFICLLLKELVIENQFDKKPS